MNYKISSKRFYLILFILLILFFINSCRNFEKSNLEDVTVIVNNNEYSEYEKLSAELLTIEIKKRTGFNWNISNEPGADGHNITLLISDSLDLKPESYYLRIEKIGDKYAIDISSSDKRGLLYGIGKFLRILEWENGVANIESEIDIDIISSPQYEIRGHQLGYRNRANSWDAWTPDQFEQYITDLAMFGANSIENIPFEDDSKSPHMKLSRDEMNVILSQICEKYDLDYWVWTPADFDLNDKIKRKGALNKHEALYRESPRLNAVFFPGGDPGHNPAPILIPYLEDISKLLVSYHPNAKVWLSLQWFGDEDVNYLYNYIETVKPKWLGGLVSGPGGRAVDDTRKRLPIEYKLRNYPDITHTVRCQYPVEWWDQAYELTLGREPINPRPIFYSKIHKQTAHFTNGFITYSDGVHDDVNKIVYLGKGWNNSIDVNEIILDYARFFFGAEVAHDAASGIFDLEENWKGALKNNTNVDETLAFWTKLEKNNPQLKNNWRWQMNLLRANYDAYTRRRLIHEEELERKSNIILNNFNELGIGTALDSAMVTISKNLSNPIEQELRIKIEELCDDLFHSIGLQTSVEKYQASGWERGCILDFVDAPLNNRKWLEHQAEKIRKMTSKAEQISRIRTISNWENPGEGSYYDNIGKISQSDHVDKSVIDALAFGWFGKMDGPPRLSTKVYIEHPKMNYKNLDSEAEYMIRVAGHGEAFLRVNGKRIKPDLYNKGYEEFKEFIIPRKLYSTGEIEITWDRLDESHLNWRYHSFISDVWLIKM